MRYVECGAMDVIKGHLEPIKLRTQMGYWDWPCVIDLNFALGSDNKELLNACYERCADDIDKALSPLQKLLIGGLRDKVYVEYQTAVENYEAYITQSGQPIGEMLYFLAPVNNALGNYDQNIEELNEYLISQKSEANTYVELAMAYKGKGNIDKAKESLVSAMSICKDADDIFIPLQEAKVLQAELN